MIGGGPAGRAVAAACSDTGLRVALVDPNPRRVWPHTYGAWRDELPASVPIACVMERMHVVGTREHVWNRPYAVLDNTALWKSLWRSDVDEIAGTAVTAEYGPSGATVVLRDGRRLAAAAVIDASGAARALSGGRPTRMPAAQTAVGTIVDRDTAEAVCPDGDGVLMDWRPAPGTRGGWPTFLYAVRLDDSRVLLEETSLARRPALPLAQLRRRLRGRLAAAGVTLRDTDPEERVRFPVDDPLPKRGHVIAFGASAAMVHPASGYSVAASLRSAHWVAGAIAAGLSVNPATAVRSAHSVLWPPDAVTTYRLRRQALRGVLALPPHRVPEFFEALFTLDPRHSTAFLRADGDPRSTATAMAVLFRALPWSLRRHLAMGALSPGNRQARHGLGGL